MRKMTIAMDTAVAATAVMRRMRIKRSSPLERKRREETKAAKSRHNQMPKELKLFNSNRSKAVLAAKMRHHQRKRKERARERL